MALKGMLQVGEKTDPQMEVYRQALSAVETLQLRHTLIVGHARLTHIRTIVHTSGAVFDWHTTKHAPIYHQDKCEVSWTVVKPSPQQDRARGSKIIIEYQIDSQQKCSLQGDWSPRCPLSCLQKSGDQRENRSLMDRLRKQPSQGFLMEMSICCFMQSTLSGETVWISTEGEKEIENRQIINSSCSSACCYVIATCFKEGHDLRSVFYIFNSRLRQ